MAQNDAFVDLAYRGLSLGRRIKLTQMRPSTGYLEHPTPMPVGTPVSIVTDDGLVLEAIVTHVHEQVGGSEKSPGMTVKPALADHKLAAWWTEHVSLPELDAKPAPERSRPVTVRPRSHTVPNPVVDAGGGVVAVASGDSARVEVTLPMPAPPLPPPVIPMATPPAMTTPPAIARIELLKTERPDTAGEDNNKKTMLMDAVDQELLEQLSRGSPTEIERLVRTTNEHPVVDDGQRTTVMDAVDPSSLGLEVSASGSMSAMDSGEIEDETNGEDDASQPVSAANGDKKSSGVKKRRKKRR